jgi:hypothetical protein
MPAGQLPITTIMVSPPRHFTHKPRSLLVSLVHHGVLDELPVSARAKRRSADLLKELVELLGEGDQEAHHVVATMLTVSRPCCPRARFAHPSTCLRPPDLHLQTSTDVSTPLTP